MIIKYTQDYGWLRKWIFKLVWVGLLKFSFNFFEIYHKNLTEVFADLWKSSTTNDNAITYSYCSQHQQPVTRSR